MKTHTFQTETWLSLPPDQVFPFFADAKNLDRITPPWLQFQILTPSPISINVGTILEYRLKWRWLPLRWRTEITDWEPPIRFVDKQIRGPYKLWRHEHTFISQNGGTLMRDRVDYAVPGWILEPIIHALLVGPDVRKIFDYRKVTVQEIFQPLQQ